MAELADALDLGSSVPDVQVQLLLSAPKHLPNIDAWPIMSVFMRVTGVLNEKFKTPVFHRCTPSFGGFNHI